MNAGRSRGGSSAAVGFGSRAFAVAEDVALRTEVLAAEEAGAWRCWGARVVTVLGRPIGRLLAAVAVVVVVVGEAANSVEGGRGGRRAVIEVREVAVEFARACVAFRGDCSLVVDVDGAPVDAPEEGRRAADVGNG